MEQRKGREIRCDKNVSALWRVERGGREGGREILDPP